MTIFVLVVLSLLIAGCGYCRPGTGGNVPGGNVPGGKTAAYCTNEVGGGP